MRSSRWCSLHSCQRAHIGFEAILPAQCNVQSGLVGVSNDGFPYKCGTNKSPKRHEEVAAADAAEVEGEVGVGGHEYDSDEAVSLEEANHPGLGRVDPGDLRVEVQLFGNLLRLAKFYRRESSGTSDPIGRDLAKCCASGKEEAGWVDLPPKSEESNRGEVGGCHGRAFEEGFGGSEPHVCCRFKVHGLTGGCGKVHFDDMGEQKQNR